MKMNLVQKLRETITLQLYENKSKPKSRSANWIIPGYIMCGVYPYMDGVNFHTKEEGDNNINKIKEDGITSFICLQDEIKNDGTCNHHYFPNFLYYPKYRKDINYYHCPIVDGNMTSIDNLIYIVNLVLSDLYDGKKFYIHCAAGAGRTGMVVSCILKTIFYEYSMQNIMRKVQSLYDSREIHDYRTKVYNYKVRSPNTDTQIQTCYEYERHIHYIVNMLVI